MARLIGDVMAEALRGRVVGRDAEIDGLVTALLERTPLVVYLHGIPGIGIPASDGNSG